MKLHGNLRAALFSGLLVAGLGLTGCGSDDDGGGGDDNGFAEQSVDKIKEAVIADMRDAKSLTMSGNVTSDEGTTTLELSSDTEGNCAGTVSMGQGSADFIQNADAVFIRADEEFWRANAGENADDVVKVIGDKWAKLPSGQNQFAEFCDLDNFIKEIDDDGDKGGDKKGEETEVDGQNAIEIISEDDGDINHVWVATEGKHYILKLQGEGDEHGEFTLTDYNEKVDAQAPAETEYVDLAELG